MFSIGLNLTARSLVSVAGLLHGGEAVQRLLDRPPPEAR